MSSGDDRPSLCLFGAPTDTGNLGVSALGLSVIAAIARRPERPELTVFDFGRGVRREAIEIDGRTYEFTRIGAMHTRRLHRPESLTRMRLESILSGWANPGLRAIRRANAVLDISGGDSFSDLYGRWRFRSIMLPKQIALSMRKPLVLLPQTYGPFNDARHRSAASKVIQQAQQVWSRDLPSYHRLQKLLGDGFDYSRHRVGVDVAFALDAQAPKDAPPEPMDEWFANREKPVAGINVSGLLYLQPDKAVERFGLQVDYRELMHRLVEMLVEQHGANVVLVPHVLKHEGNDVDACEAVKRQLPEELSKHVAVVRGITDARHIKWYISQCDWFTGARMHSTIASLSSGVPTAGMAYSLKMQGVFDVCNAGSQVVDLREASTHQALDATLQAWSNRNATRRTLNDSIGQVRERAVRQLNEILDRYLVSSPVRNATGSTQEASERTSTSASTERQGGLI